MRLAMTTLSFALPKYEAAINELFDEAQFSLHMQDEILRLFPPVYVVHTGITRLVSSPNILDKLMKPHKTKFSMDPRIILQTDVPKFKDVVLGMTNDLLDQQKRQAADVMLETGEAVGHSFDSKNRNFWDTYIEMLQKAPYSEGGYKVFMNPDTEKKIKEIPQTLEQRQRIKDVIDAKREEYFANKRSRRL
jgi:hypothetical protein